MSRKRQTRLSSSDNSIKALLDALKDMPLEERCSLLGITPPLSNDPPISPCDAARLKFCRRRTPKEWATMVVCFEPDLPRSDLATLADTSERNSYRLGYEELSDKFAVRRPTAASQWQGNPARRRPLHPQGEQIDDHEDVA